MNYIVQPGDSLSKIARDVLGNMDLWPQIAEMNNITDVNVIIPGQVLKLPDVTTANAASHVSQPTPLQTAGGGKWMGLLVLLLVGGAIYVATKEEQKKEKQ